MVIILNAGAGKRNWDCTGDCQKGNSGFEGDNIKERGGEANKRQHYH